MRTIRAMIVGLALGGSVPAWADYETGARAWNAGRPAEALEHWLTAAHAQDHRAMLALGRLYLRGVGAPQDFVLAHMWFNLAASRGAREAIREREEMTARMTPSERAEAQKRARAWRPGPRQTTEYKSEPEPEPEPETTAGPPSEQAVREAQKLLAALGYEAGPVDGKWGNRTAGAYRSFLRDAGRLGGGDLTTAGLRALREVAASQGESAEPARSPAKPAPRLLLRAARAGDVDRARAVLDSGADANPRDSRGWTPLMHAASRGFTALIPLLLDAGAHTNLRAPDGATALLVALLQGHAEAARLLARAGADPTIAGPRGKTPLDVARQRNFDGTIALLKEASADRAGFSAAQQAGTAAAYGKYLALHRDGMFVREATRLRDESLDREAFRKARAINTAQAHRDYLAKIPNGKFREQATRMVAALDTAEFRQAEKTGSSASYGQYIASNRAGLFIEQAMQRRNRLLDQEAFTAARSGHTIEAYESYLRDPGGKYREQAQAAIRELKELIDFRKARSKNTVAAYNDYLALYRDGRHAGEARRLRVRARVVGRAFRDCERCPEMVVVPPGSFMMGSDDGDPDEQPRHRVTISEPFAVGKHEVTVGQFRTFVQETGRDMTPGTGFLGLPSADSCTSPRVTQAIAKLWWDNPGYAQQEDFPVSCTSWKDAAAYVEWIAGKTARPYRLLSEAEWEYVTRATTGSAFHFGATISTDRANFNAQHDATLSTGSKYRRKATRVGAFPPNRFGLHDLHGNVFEWVADCWHRNYDGAPTDGAAWTRGGNCSVRIVRGGSWFNPAPYLRAAFRNSMDEDIRLTTGGFRIARAVDPGVLLSALKAADKAP